MNRTLRILSADPSASPTEIANQIGRSRQTVYDYIEELQMAGKVNRNGNSVQISD